MSRTLIGRDEELRQIVELLDEWRLVTIVGPGGAGKTRLAEAVLEDVDGSTETYFVGLASHTNHRLAETAAAELGSSSLEDFCRATADRSALVVLDNCEHVLDAAATVAILATSREPLELEDERLVPLVGLPTEAPAGPSPAAELYLSEVEARGVAMNAELHDVERLVRQLDGLPLAIELAAAKARTASPAEMLHDLEPRIDLLSRRRDRGPSRHRSLAAAIRWSYEQLNEEEQQFLLACSLFEGLFTHGMAAAITGKSRTEAVALLQGLVDRSLVHHEQIGAATWHRLLVTIRMFCRDELRRVESPEVSQERLAAAALQLVEAQPYSHLSIGYEDGAARATAAFDTVRKVVDHCVALDGHPDRVYRILRWVWWLDAGAYQSEATNLCDRVFTRWNEPAHPAWPLAAASAATLDRDVGRRDEARAMSQAVLESTDGVAQALAHRTLGLMHRAQGDYEIARHHFATAIELAATAELDALVDELRIHLALNLA